MSDNTVSKIPDVWFDIFARLFPGTVGFSAILFKFDAFPNDATIGSATWIIFCGYILGHSIQPLTTYITVQGLERIVGAKAKKEAAYQRVKDDSRSARTLSKQHAETVGFFAVALLFAILPLSTRPIAWAFDFDQSAVAAAESRLPSKALFILAFFWTVCAIERAFAQKMRAARILENKFSS